MKNILRKLVHACIITGMLGSYASVAAAATAIAVNVVLLPSPASASWQSAADKVIADALAGTLTTNAAVSVPTDYAVTGHTIGWSNLVVSTTTPMWQGVLNPPSLFQSERGQIPWLLVDMRDLAGNDTVSLDHLSVVSSSNDGNQLGSTTTFSGLSYTPRAVVVRADNTVVTSGPDSQKGKRVLVLVVSPMFNGGDSQQGLDQDKAWVNSFSNPWYTLSWTAQVIGDASTASSTFVTTGAAPAPPVSVSSRGVGGLYLSVSNAIPAQSYRVDSRGDLTVGSWQFYGLINGTNALFVPIIAGQSQQFYRVGVQ